DLGTSRRRHGAGASSGSATAVLFDIEALERGLVGSPVLPGSRPAPGTVRASGGTPAAPGTPSAATVVLPRTEVGGPGGDGGARGEAPPRRRRRRWPWALGLVLLAALSGGGVALARVLLVPSYPVPRLGGMDPAHAAAALHAGRFVLRTDGSAWDGSVPAGRIDQQSPLPGAELRRGSVVSVVLSKGAAPRAVPSLQNEGQVEAVAKLAAAGFGHKVDTAYSETVAAGSVISYSPQGTQRYGTEVTLTVSEGPQPRTVPSFGGGTTYDQAAAALSHEQLVASRSDQFSSTVPAGTVIGTSPAAGQPATRGSTVTVAVSKGPELVAVPTDLQGATVAQAKADLSQAGLTVGNVWGPSGPRARVFAIDPSVGNMVAPGTPVNLYTL
ncbi:MAG: PASTA domain-containing protein, partial [Acidimicrobiales bacterium]